MLFMPLAKLEFRPINFLKLHWKTFCLDGRYENFTPICEAAAEEETNTGYDGDVGCF